MRWELRTAQPMLNLAFFRNPRFSIASGGISLAFFSLFGAIFALTQFLQDAKGYSALEAGAAMVPLALGLVMGAGSGIKLNEQLGHRQDVVVGRPARPRRPARERACSGASTCRTGRSACGSSRVALSMGWVMGPATDSVMGAVPEEKSGVASAMNDVTRQVAGALGTAVIGSLIASLYASRIGDSVAGAAGAGARRRRGLGRPGQRGRRAAAGRAGREPRRVGGATRSRRRSASASPSPARPR